MEPVCRTEYTEECKTVKEPQCQVKTETSCKDVVEPVCTEVPVAWPTQSTGTKKLDKGHGKKHKRSVLEKLHKKFEKKHEKFEKKHEKLLNKFGKKQKQSNVHEV